MNPLETAMRKMMIREFMNKNSQTVKLLHTSYLSVAAPPALIVNNDY